jgi:hypothetical protein
MKYGATSTMKNVAQFTQSELVQLIAEKLSADGFKVIPADYEIEFVTSASGETSALVTGVVKDPDLTDAVPDGDAPTTVRSTPTHQLPAGLERSTRVGLQVALTFKPQTQEKLTKKVLEIIAREEGDNDAFIDFLRNPVNIRRGDRLLAQEASSPIYRSSSSSRCTGWRRWRHGPG